VMPYHLNNSIVKLRARELHWRFKTPDFSNLTSDVYGAVVLSERMYSI
jgi:hypothetical protein